VFQRERPAQSGREPDLQSIGRLVREAALNAYGVASVGAHGLVGRLGRRLRRKVPGVEIDYGQRLQVRLDLALIEDVPPAAVAANVAESVRYVVQRETGRLIDELVLVVNGQPMDLSTNGSSRRQQA
jgi:uncharacterized alkaline shock family protein YloU